ncbi:MAG: hypothetical protein FWH55_11700 [Oscillospiraceae bacterium]|nr:hypothetical protein [Oscillospiraceae bacterium]
MLSKGEKLATKSGLQLTITDGPWSGGQGAVYRVTDQRGHVYALKWYHDTYLNTEEKKKDQWDSLSKIVGKSVGAEFAWPLELVSIGASFGYIMEFVDYKRFIPLAKMKSGVAKYQPSLQTKVLISLNICNAFAKLHARGLCYRDINEGNIMFDVSTGDIKIMDNDNVGIEGASKSNVRGVPDFMAPEILCDFANTSPSKMTDYHSVAVYLFQLWMWHHPFDGNNVIYTRCFDRDAKVIYYGREPKFIFSPNNDNPLDPIADAGTKDEEDYSYVHKLWAQCPEILQKLFIRAFTEGAKAPNKRPIDNAWAKAFRTVSDMTLRCPHCNAENLLCNKQVCWKCKKKYEKPLSLVVKKKDSPLKTAIVLNVDKYIYANVFNVSEGTSGIAKIAQVVAHPKNPSVLGLRNCTSGDFSFTNAKGETVVVPPGKSVPVSTSNIIDFGNDYFGSFIS